MVDASPRRKIFSRIVPLGDCLLYRIVAILLSYLP
jgi:hypothetical protein